MLCYDVNSVTDVGNIREINQDNYFAYTEIKNDKSVGIFCVADGMGGLRDGEYASCLAVTKTKAWYQEHINMFGKKTPSDKRIVASLKQLFYEINDEIYRYGIDKGIRVGTTYSLLLLTDDRYFVIHAGDSRIYLKRLDKLYMLTKDQTWVNDQLERGLISREQAQNHPRKNVLSNCIGCFEEPSVCIGSGKIAANDSFMLCSDGLYNLVTNEEISQALSCSNLDYTVQNLLARVKERGAYDNITLLMVRIDDCMSKQAITVEL